MSRTRRTASAPSPAWPTTSIDTERTDGYGRTLAKVVHRGANVSAEIAREGLGLAMAISPNLRFFPEVQAAEQQARAAGRGLFAAGSTCTVEAMVEQQIAALEPASTAPAGADASVEDYVRHLPLLTAELDRARRLLTDLVDPPDRFPWRGRHDGDLFEPRTNLLDAVSRAETRVREWQQERQRLATPTARPTPTAPRSQPEREATSAPTRAATTESDSKSESRERPVTKAPTTTKPATKAPTTRAPKPAEPAPQPTSEYTGPRCYEPGGKSWRPC